MTSSPRLAATLSQLIPLLVIVVGMSWFLRGFPGSLRAAASFGLACLSLLASKTWCSAPTTDGKQCRNNTYGLLRACHHHTHQEAKAAMRRSLSYWRGLALAQYSGRKGARAFYLTVAGAASGLVAALLG